MLVNPSGISPKKDGKKRPFFDISLEEWQRVLDINLTGPFLLMKAAYPVLARHDGASIVNIISITAKTGASGPEGSSFPPFSPSGAHYAASKAALKNLTLSMSRELAPLGIRCNGVSPGYVGTGMGGTTAGDLNEVMLPQIPLGRSATTDEVAAVVSFLVSPGRQLRDWRGRRCRRGVVPGLTACGLQEQGGSRMGRRSIFTSKQKTEIALNVLTKQVTAAEACRLTGSRRRRWHAGGNNL